MKTSRVVIAAFLVTAALLSGCANSGSQSRPASSSGYGADYGVIESIETVQGGGGNGIGAGTVIGGVLGGVLGHQVGGGTGKDVATVAGVVGGAVVGHEMEKSNRQQDAYRIHIRLESGQFQTVMQQSVSDLRVGDRVRIENGRITRD